MIALPSFLAVLAVFLAFGDRLCRLLGLGSERPAERFGMSLAASFAVTTLAVFLLALPRWVNFWSMLALLAAMAVVGRELPSWVRGLRCGPLAGAFLGLGLVAAMAPPTGIDTLIFHFVAPKQWLQAGGLLADPHPVYHRAGGFYFVYLFGMALQNDLLAKLLHFGASTAAVALCGATAERLREGAGGWATAAALSPPVVASYLGYEFLELPALMYVAAGLHLALREKASAALAFWGFALGVKPSNLAVLLPAAALLWSCRGRRALPGLAVAALAAGFWPAWNLLTKAGPLPSYETSSAAAVSTWGGMLQVGVALLGSPPYWSDALGPLLLVGLAGLAWLRDMEGRRLSWQALACVVFYLGVLALLAPRYLAQDVHSHVRYLSPVLVGLGAPAAGLFLARIPRRWALAALLVPALPLLALKAGRTAVAAPAALGLQSADAYLARKVETYEACRAVNAMPGKLRVLAWIYRPYHLAADRLALVSLGAEDTKSGPALGSRARALGITHLLVEPGYLDRMGIASEDAYFEGSGFRRAADWPQPDGRRIRLYELQP